MPVIIPNPFWPQVASRGQNPESLLSGGHPGTKSFQMTPQPPFYMAWRPGSFPATAEFNRDAATLQRLLYYSRKAKCTFQVYHGALNGFKNEYRACSYVDNQLLFYGCSVKR